MRVVAERARGLGLVGVDLRERGEVHDRIGPERVDRLAHRIVIADVERRVVERMHLVVRRHLREERSTQAPTRAGDDQPQRRPAGRAPRRIVANPVGMDAVPLDGSRQAFVERHRGTPAEFVQTLARHAVAEVVTGAVGHERHQRLVGAHQAADRTGQLSVRQFEAVADVEDHAGFAVVQRGDAGGGPIGDVEPFARLAAVVVDGERPAFERGGGEDRDRLLRVLPGPERVGAADDPHRQAVGDAVGAASSSAAALLAAYGLRGRIGESSSNIALGLVLAVDLVGRDQQERPVVRPARIEHHLRADDVGQHELGRAADATGRRASRPRRGSPGRRRPRAARPRRGRRRPLHEPRGGHRLVLGEVGLRSRRR